MKKNALKKILGLMLIIALLAAPISALAASKTAYILKVSATPAAYLRSYSSGSNSQIIDSLRTGTKVIYWGTKKDQMLKVMTASGETGYCYQGNLKVYGAVKTSQIYRTNSSAAVYKRSGSSMKKIGTVKKNTMVFVYGTRGSYSLVKNLAGKSGYIKTSKLKKAI